MVDGTPHALSHNTAKLSTVFSMRLSEIQGRVLVFKVNP